MTRHIKNVAVYCGHSLGTNPNFERDAKKMGKLIAENGLRLIFGGGNVGLMGAVSTAAVDNGGDVFGITTEHVVAMQEPVHEKIDVRVVSGLSMRKQEMFDLSDAFIILPGGPGTLDEVTDIITKQQVGETDKPIYFLNTDGFWNVFGLVVNHMVECGFANKNQVLNIRVANTPEELIQRLTDPNDLVRTGFASDN
ncbi:MAG: TIGR00730 family Rossman fold protein [Alphaproteobacteria bacterium]|nr:TIGR00730 family Rossman fold protein [Alphaproteobacteria bacterium]